MKKISYYLIAIVSMGFILVSFWIYIKYFKGDKENILMFEVKRGGIQESIRVRGEVASQKEFNLEFPFSGIVDEIFVKEGQNVTEGERLIKLETIDFEIEQRKLEAGLSQSKAVLNKLIAGASEEDINVLEAQVQSAKQSLADVETNLSNIETKASVDLDNLYADINDILNDAYAKAEDAVNKQTDELFINDLTTSPQLSFLTSDSQAEIDAENKRALSNTELKELKSDLANLNLSNADLDTLLLKSQDRLSNIREFLIRTNNALNSAVDLSQVNITAYKANLTIARANINTAMSSINTQKQAISAQKSTNQNNIDAAKAQISSAESALNVANSQLVFKKALPRSEDIEIAKAQVSEIENQIAAVREKIRKATLSSPIPAKISKIFFKEKEFFRTGQSAVSLIAFDFKIQADISELEIGKINDSDGNNVSVQFDAFAGEMFSGKVVSIEPKEVLKDGDKYYRADIYFEDRGISIRPGMSADLMIKIQFKENVVKIPEIVVYKKDKKKFVILSENGNQKETEIETGISDGELIEVTKGLSEGQIVIMSIK